MLDSPGWLSRGLILFGWELLMLTGLRLQNFKAWQDTGEIRLAPLTVFFGTNSSGKTSIHQLLLMLKQTAESPDRRRVLHAGDRNTAVDLGTFQDMVHGHRLDSAINFELSWRLQQALEIKDAESQQTLSGRDMVFRAEIRRGSEAGSRMFVHEMWYELGNPDDGGLRAEMRRNRAKYELEVKPRFLERRRGRPADLPAPDRFFGFPDEAVANYKNSGFLADLTLELQTLLESLYYVGPLRSYPERQYLWSGEAPQHVGWRGERTIEALLAAQHRRVLPGAGKRGRTFEQLTASWLKQMGLIERFNLRPIEEGRREYEVLIQTYDSRSKVQLTDVGFGLSQVLPVIVQCFYAPHGSTILFEQPEIHLHPKVQASLADLFIEAIRSREGSKDRNNQLLIESHSEHFLRRLQRRVAEAELAPEEVAIYFCAPSPEGSIISELELDEFGNIQNWPAEFFGDEMGELTAMTEAASRRQLAAIET